MPVSVPARRPRSSTAATRPRPTPPPRASSRRSRSTSPAARLWRAGGLLLAERRTPHLLCDRADSGPLAAFSSLHSSGRPDGLSLLAPVGETHPEAQTRRDRETCAALRFREAWFSPGRPEVGVAAAPPLPLLLRASATARDARPSGARKRAPANRVSRPSRRGPPHPRHADCRLRKEGANYR